MPRSSLCGFAPGGVYHADAITGRAVRSCRTFSPWPRLRERMARWFVFCGTFPRVAPAGRYPAPLFHGARTFLCPRAAAIQPTDQPALGRTAGAVKPPQTREQRHTLIKRPRTAPQPSRQGAYCASFHQLRPGANGRFALLHNTQPPRDFGIGLDQATHVTPEAILVELVAGFSIPQATRIG